MRAYDETEASRRKPAPATKGELDLWADIFLEDAESKQRVLEENRPVVRVSATGVERVGKRGKRHPQIPKQFTPIPDSAPGWSRAWSSIGPEADAMRAAQRDRWRELLLPIVRELAESSGPVGFMPCDVVSRGITTGILLGEWFVQRHPRVYSWSGHFLATCAGKGLIVPLMDKIEGQDRFVHREGISDRDASKGNPAGLYVHPRYANPAWLARQSVAA